MAHTCEVCGKTVRMGHNVRLQARGSKWVRRAPKTARPFFPNVQRATLIVNGVPTKLNICTRCLRTAHKVRS